MNALLIWAIGSIIATVLTLITVVVAFLGYGYARRSGDALLVRSARQALMVCVVGLSMVLSMVIVAASTMLSIGGIWVVWLLLALPWLLALSNGLQLVYIWRLSRERGKDR